MITRVLATRAPRRAGMTIVEGVLSVALFATLMLTFTQLIRLQARSSAVQLNEAGLALDLHESLHELADFVRYSGFTPDGVHPYLFEDGVPDPDHAVHAHDAPNAPVTVGESPSREVVYLLADDQDADSRPDVDAGGNVIWSATEYSLVLVPDAHGRNRVECRTGGGLPKVICRNVESLVIDDTATGVDVPLGCLRIRMVLSRDAEEGTMEVAGEVTVRVRNGGIR